MSESLTRLLSGVIYALLLLFAIFINEYVFVLLVFVFGIILLTELQQLLKTRSYVVYIILLGFLLFFTVFDAFEYVKLKWLLMILTLVIDLLLIRDLVIIRKIPLFESRKYLMMVFYLISSLVFLTLIPYQNPHHEYNPSILIGVFVLIWSNDSFAYIVGKSIGKRKLFERISPNKTVEGFIGGIVFTMLVAVGIDYVVEVFDVKIWLSIALMTGIFGTFGDLIQSKLKRQAKVKDSGRLMPGHGGLFDRLDSTLFAATFIYSYLLIINNVS